MKAGFVQRESHAEVISLIAGPRREPLCRTRPDVQKQKTGERFPGSV